MARDTEKAIRRIESQITQVNRDLRNAYGSLNKASNEYEERQVEALINKLQARLDDLTDELSDLEDQY
jgi:predicted  nucleic acid-binding Zn-ribbon protein